MKNLITIIFLLSGVISLNAQSLISSTYFTNGEVKLRWTPNTFKVYSNGVANGYTIKRYKLVDDGTIMSEANILASEVILYTDIIPESEQIINDNIANQVYNLDDMATLLKAILYNTSLPHNPPSNGDEIKANQNFKNDMVFAYTAIADRDFEIAKSAALGVTDVPDDINDEYRYIISTTVNGDTVESTVDILPSQIVELSKMSQLKAIGGDSIVELNWNDFSEIFYAYEVQRSTDSINFDLITPQPFIYGVTNDIPNSNIKFYDSLADNTTKYFYQVRGLSIFNEVGIWSDVVSVEGVDGPLGIQTALSILSLDESFIEVGLKMSTSQFMDKLDHFDIYQSTSAVDGYTKVNPNPIPPSQTTFLIPTDGRSYYYVLILEDVNGNKYKSNAILGQPDDITPPAIPSGLSVETNQEGEVLLTWEKNTTDIDLAGYRVYRGNTEGDHFFDVDGYTILGNSYLDNVDPNVTTDKICYKVVSTDKRGNYSDFSTTVCVDRPDNIPPSNPFLASLFPVKEGVKISWELSQSIDVAKHILQRKRKDVTTWTTILTWKVDEPLQTQVFGSDIYQYNYIDKAPLLPVTYEYRLLAEDEVPNNSSSDIKSVVPQAQLNNEHILNMQIISECGDEAIKKYLDILTQIQNAQTSINGNNSQSNINNVLLNLLTSGTITLQQYGNMVNQPPGVVTAFTNSQTSQVNQKLMKLKCVVRLNWEFLISQENITYIELYRTTDPHEDPELLNVISSDELIVYDDYTYIALDFDVTPNVKYYYQVMMHMRDGSESKFSKIKDILVQP